MLGAAEVHFVEILRARIRGDELLHDLHGFDGAAELVVGARLLVEHLVVVLVGRILLEQAVVELDRLERTGAREVVLDAFRELSLQHVLRGRDALLLVGPLLELLLGADGHDADACRGLRCRRGAGVLQVDGLRRRQLEHLAGAVQPVFLLDLQIGQAAHRFRRALRLRRFLEETLVAVHRRVEAALDLHVLQIRRDVVQRCQRVLPRRAGARSEEHRTDEESGAPGAHHRAPPAPARPRFDGRLV